MSRWRFRCRLNWGSPLENAAIRSAMNGQDLLRPAHFRQDRTGFSDLCRISAHITH